MAQTPPFIRIQNLTQFSDGQDWRVRLFHSRPTSVLIWVGRGQGLVLLDGARRGLGAHNALFVPAGTPFALDLARQTVLQAVIFAPGVPVDLPQTPQHLRITEMTIQSELTALIDAAAREALAQRPLTEAAMAGHSALISVWLRRQALAQQTHKTRQTAAQKLSRAFSALLAEQYTSGLAMAGYAAQLGVTPTHLTRAVKSAMGKTAAELITERVLHEARRRLQETAAPGKDIAAALGFNSAAYFTRFIQQHTGAPPSKLRAA